MFYWKKVLKTIGHNAFPLKSSYPVILCVLKRSIIILSFVLLDTTTGTRHGRSGRRLVWSAARDAAEVGHPIHPIRHTTTGQGPFPKRNPHRWLRATNADPTAAAHVRIPAVHAGISGADASIRRPSPRSRTTRPSPREMKMAKGTFSELPRWKGTPFQKRPSQPDRASGPSGPRIRRLTPRPG